MFSLFKASPRALVYAILVHVGLGLLVVLSLESTPDLRESGKKKVNIVNAVAVDESRVQEEIQRLKKLEQKKRDNQKSESDKLKKLTQQRKKEEQRIADLKKKRAEEEKKRKVEQEKAKKEAARLAKLKKEKAALEKKRKAEEKRLADLAAERKMEQERKQKAEEAAKQQAAEAALKAKLAEEDRQLKAAQTARLNSLREKYMISIRNKVRSKWIRPPGEKGNLSCKVGVQQIPGGEVVNVTVTSCDGSESFKRSVELAVYKASPLPIPAVTDLFERDIEFTFRSGE
ncbi:MAG: cell envelope integrity protein TolA [Gammaproteobacteria bacterium]|nr:cell envelope integrity protein TolA [Gammaproteobacteria bacterium]MDH5594683.1 cell envelope integrity protein TolA [Gammaproteobacteria bacterium]